MAKKSLRKAMILVMELIILSIFKAEANVLAPCSLRRTSLPIRLLLQSSQPGNDYIPPRCFESTIEKCEHIKEAHQMAFCVTHILFSCIFKTQFPIDMEKFYKAIPKCTFCLGNNVEAVHRQHAYCFVHCLDVHI
jgi:hypothetical protein